MEPAHLLRVDSSSPLTANASARELAARLLSPLEAIANLHYLLDLHVVNPERLKELRKVEDEAFEQMLQLVLSCAKE